MEMKDELDRDIERLRTYDHIIQSFKYLLLMHMIIFVGETNCVFVLKSVIVRKWSENGKHIRQTFVCVSNASSNFRYDDLVRQLPPFHTSQTKRKKREAEKRLEVP